MGDNHQQEWNLLLPLLPALLIVPILSVLGVEPLDLGFAAILAPFLMFPIVLLVGQIWNGNDIWVGKLKEGGILALASLAVSLIAAFWMIVHFLSLHEKKVHGDSITWLNFDVLSHDGTQWSVDAGFTNISFGIWLDSVSIMLLFVATTILLPLPCWRRECANIGSSLQPLVFKQDIEDTLSVQD